MNTFSGLALRVSCVLVLTSLVGTRVSAEENRPNTLLGKVLEVEGGGPAGRAMVSVRHHESGAFASVRCKATGAFVLSSLPSGTYRVLVETDEGIFVSESVVKLRLGEGRSFILRPRIAPVQHGLVQGLELPGDAAESIVGLLDLKALPLRVGR